MGVVRAPIGRDREVGHLLGALQQARGGVATVVFVEGEAGIGKSRLLETLAVEAEHAGFRVFRGEADELDVRTLGVVLDALSSARSNSVIDPSGGTSSAAEAPVDVLERVALESPVLVTLDDLHWADEASVGWIRQATRRLTGLPVLVVGAMRLSPRKPVLDALVPTVADGGLLRLGPLRNREIHALVAPVLGTRLDPPAAQTVRAAGGNPYLALELARALAEGSLAPGDRALPATLRSLVVRGSSRWSPTAWRRFGQPPCWAPASRSRSSPASPTPPS